MVPETSDPEVNLLLQQARAGLASLDVAPALQASALSSLAHWLTDRSLRSYQPQVRALIEDGRWTVILDSFYQTMPFGTGGRRGPVGVGPNRFNPRTLGASVQGHAAFLRQEHGEGAHTVVVACDVRVFHDLRGELVGSVPTPVMGMTSRDFAHIAAEVYTAAGFAVVLPPRSEALSTPELSFAIRALGAVAGLQISASHNHPDDNGGKFYNASGGQEVPPRDQLVADHVAAVDWIDRMSLDRARASGLVTELPDHVVEGYQRAVLAAGRVSQARSARVVFTALHGTGRRTALPVLEAAGFDVFLEPTQAEPDGRFPAAPFRAPNPEVPASLAAGVAHAEALGADIVLGCDPDADRIGLMVREQPPAPDAALPARWRFVTGNEIAALVVHHALQGRPTVPGAPAPLIIQTEVTSRLVERVAALHGARVVSDLLVGFKYVGELLDRLEDDGELDTFAAGVEESHGVLVTPALRDKDAAGGALLLAELASIERDRHRTLADTIADLQRRTGGVCNLLCSAVLTGASGRATIEAIQAGLRAHRPQELGGRKVLRFTDHQDPTGPRGPVRSATDRASRDVLAWELEGGARVVLRPSGTEPKLKAYLEVSGTPAAPRSQRELRREVRLLADAVMQAVLARGGLQLPAWAVRISDLVPVEDKQHFAERVLPGVVARVVEDNGALAGAGEWLDRCLVAYGPGARSLFTPAVAAFVADTNPPFGDLVLRLFS